MGYKSNFLGWSHLNIEDLLVAYRKAKADCFFEKSFPIAIKFAEYEQSLLLNLEKLLKELQENKGFESSSHFLGKYRLLPKKLSTKQTTSSNGHVHFSNPNRAVEHFLDDHEIVPEFRIVGDFPVESHIISALWINMVGHKFDSKLDDCCYGGRLKRVRNDELFDEKEEKPFHISSIGSFEPYYQPYQKWRGDGLEAIRDQLENDKNIIAVSLDLKSYYHFLDPLVLGSKELHKSLGVRLNKEESEFTSQLARFLDNWSAAASEFGKEYIYKDNNINGGLVIGLTASRIVSNVLLSYWDRLVQEKLSPIHYGRYVDDMFLVIGDTSNVGSNNDLMQFIQDRIGEDHFYSSGKDDQAWYIQQGKDLQGESNIQLQSDKQKLFILQGRAGLDLLDSIEKDIYQLSSEHRLMPLPGELEKSTAAKVLSAAGSIGENADTLRKADGLTIRRLSWALQLRHVETLAKDLPSHEWREQRQEFYSFAFNHVIRADSIFSHFSYLPRLLGFSISMNEWEQAERICKESYRAIDLIANKVVSGKKITVNGCESKTKNNIWNLLKGTLTWLFIDSVTRYYDSNKLLLNQSSPSEKRLSIDFLSYIFNSFSDAKDLLDLNINITDFEKNARLVALSDLANKPYKSILKSSASEKLVGRNYNEEEAKLLKILEDSNFISVEDLKLFLNSTIKSRLANVKSKSRTNESKLPYIFPTRPFTPMEISELAPECVGLLSFNKESNIDRPSSIWARYTQAVRGVWVKPSLLAHKEEQADSQDISSSPFLIIGNDNKKKVVVALTNIKMNESDWAASACNKPNLSSQRYHQIANVVNEIIRLSPKPDYVLFPELCIPLEWVDSIANSLSRVGISLIAGTEYFHINNSQLFSEAVLVLSDNRLGYPSTVKIWQPKLEPAVNEDKELVSKFGKTWASSYIREKAKPVYAHNDFFFGVMICSELLNSKDRISFQGNVDALMSLSWNQDLNTFSSLVESTALDVHAYVVLVNNRKYGDSRVRSPARETFMRDLARLKGGDNDFVVAATLDIDSLRAFQSRAKRWTEENDKFKPVPEGFELNPSRKRLPPK